ncbi:MAG TPA: DUF2750 domain-containing protein [Geobacteraceae bacterium]
MTYTINQQQFEAVLTLPANERYDHFIKRVADSEEAWGLRSEGGWSLAGDEKQAAFPLWPYKVYAEACATGEWADAVPEAIEIEDLTELLEKLDAEGLVVAVFPTPQGKGVVVTPDELRQHLEHELQNYL